VVEFRQSGSDVDNRVDAKVAAVYFQDQIELGARWEAVLGVRYDHFDLEALNHRDGQELARVDEMISPRVGLVFKPAERMSIYGTYSVSYLPSAGDQFASLTPTTRTLEPEGFTNREVGVKWDLRPALSLTGALYRLDRTNTTAPDPDDATRIVQTGLQRSTGHELALTGNLTSAWQIVAGYTAQEARIVNATTAAPAGAIVPLVPRQTFSLWNRYQLVSRIGAGVGIVHQTKMFAAIDNTVTLPSFTRVDAAAFLTLTQTLRAQVNIENLFDERYYPTSHGNNNIAPGGPRTVRFSLTATPR
jgi:catecholate siderophore receptor